MKSPIQIAAEAYEKRDIYLEVGDKLLILIEQKKWSYPLDKFQVEYKAFKRIAPWMIPPGYVGTVLGIFVVMVFWILVAGPFLGILIAGSIGMSVLIPHNQAIRLSQPFIENVDRLLAGKMSLDESSNLMEQVPNDSIENIKRLHDLLQAGALSQEEYDSEKRKLLRKTG